jgi:hypothetical protein
VLTAIFGSQKATSSLVKKFEADIVEKVTESQPVIRLGSQTFR